MSTIARLSLLLVVAGTLVALRPGSPAAAATVTITIGSSGSLYGPYWFCDSSDSGGVCTTMITAGDTITWQNDTSTSHTSTECGASCGTTPPGPAWDSGTIPSGGSYSHTFNQAGTFTYQCNIHPTQMMGQIIVSPGGTPVPAPNGDVNKDGAANAIDAALVLQYSAGYLPSINANGDVNQDGRTNSIDAALILQYVAGLIPAPGQIPMPKVHGEPTVTPSGLTIYEIRAGTGTEARAADTVTVNYTGWLADGTMFDTSFNHSGAVQFPLTAVIPGWAEGVPGMKVRGKRRLVIPPELAYGEQGVEGVIPSNATLTFDIELLSIP